MIGNSQINKEMNLLNIVHPVSKPEYGMLFEHQGYLLQGLGCLYLFVAIKLPWVTDLLHDPDLMPECDKCAEQYNVTTSQRSSIVCDPRVGHTPGLGPSKIFCHISLHKNNLQPKKHYN